MAVDFYKQCQDAVSGVLKADLPEFFEHDWQLTDNEYDFGRGANHFVLYRPGQIPPPIINERDGEFLEIHWQVICNVALRYIQKNLQWSQFLEFRGAVWYTLQKPRLIDQTHGIWRILNVTANQDPSYWDFSKVTSKAPNSNFMLQPLIVAVKQTIEFNF